MQIGRKLSGEKSFIVSIILLLFLYHLANFPFQKTIKRPLRSYSVFEVATEKTTWIQIKTIQTEIKTRIDRTADFLAGIGFIARYLIGQYPYDMFDGSSKDRLYLFDRQQIPFQYPKMISKVEGSSFLTESKSFIEDLAHSGVLVLSLPIPTHLSIDRKFAPEQLPASERWIGRPSTENENAQAVYESLTNTAPDNFVNLFAHYRNYLQASPKAQLFLPYDNHWSSEGIAVAARAVIEKLVSRKIVSGPLPQVHEIGEKQISFKAQMLSYLQLPEYFLKGFSKFSWEEKLFTLKKLEPLKPNSLRRIIVAGTSFSERFKGSREGFGETLSQALALPSLTYEVPGGDWHGALSRMESEGFTFRPGDLLIWEYHMPSVVETPFTKPLPRLTPPTNPS